MEKLKNNYPRILKSIGFTIVAENVKDLQTVSELATKIEVLYLYRIAAESPV